MFLLSLFSSFLAGYGQIIDMSGPSPLGISYKSNYFLIFFFSGGVVLVQASLLICTIQASQPVGGWVDGWIEAVSAEGQNGHAESASIFGAQKSHE